MEDCAQFAFLGSWAFVAPYLCFKFHIFYRPGLEEYVFQVSFSHTFVQFEITFFLQLERCTFLLRVWWLPASQICEHLWRTSITIHLLGLSWKMIPFLQHLDFTFVLVWAMGWDYGWFLNHLSIHFASHILLSS
jgi:hypothetical protein